ncbi:DUF4245 domain-containing protein [Falsarthrobacter nasiphocae]|uniref:DUF4245 domain-containing protein n=1 Tax=Falsarthrobacter nasiphocae TaxID=189863 RepID=A0AAE4C610_9MICC|nr:DUF4245 domain-containing protein [Falsarthrobacter nasiphocae]MDR6891637.1 hypothetical protein [Falsarthrobacter nasiphocae]
MSTQSPATPVLTKKQAQRANSSVIGMLIAIGLSLALVLPVLLLVPQKKDDAFTRRVDVASIAAQAGTSQGFRPVAPSMPEDYPSNHAELSQGDQSKVPTWTVGYVTPSRTYMKFIQTNKANPTWLAQQTKGPEAERRTEGGLAWTVYASGGNEQTWVARRGESTFLVSGEASSEDLARLAAAIGTAK